MKSVYAVAGILRRDDKILIAERPLGKPYSGFWEFPGGKVEANESGEAALIRELHEELGIEVLSSETIRVPTVTKSIDEDKVDEIIKLIDKLEDEDDVTNVFHNMNMDEG